MPLLAGQNFDSLVTITLNFRKLREKVWSKGCLSKCILVNLLHCFQSFAWECLPGSGLQRWQPQKAFLAISVSSICRFCSQLCHQHKGFWNFERKKWLFLWIQREIWILFCMESKATLISLLVVLRHGRRKEADILKRTILLNG